MEFRRCALPIFRRCGGFGIRIGFAPVLQRLLDLVTQTPCGPSQVRFKYLSDVHSAWHAPRIEHAVAERPVFKERHAFHRPATQNHTLLTVATRQLDSGSTPGRAKRTQYV